MGNYEAQLRSVTLERPHSFSSPFSGEEFVAMVRVIDTAVSDEERASLTGQLVRQGCRYAVCGGHECSIWHDSVDMAFLETDPGLQPPNEKFVMTTWHEGESVEEVAEFLALNTSFDNFLAMNFLLLLVGSDVGLARRAFDTVRNFLRASAA